MSSPKRFPDRDDVAAVLAECEPLEPGGKLDATRRLAGRAMARRGMGKRAGAKARAESDAP